MVDKDGEVRQQIEDCYARFCKATLGNDIDAVMGTFTPDLVWMEQKDHPIDREAVRKELVQFMASFKPGSRFWVHIEKFKIDSDDQVEAYAASHFAGPDGKDQAPGKPKFVFHDTWVRIGGVWKNSRAIVEPWKG